MANALYPTWKAALHGCLVYATLYAHGDPSLHEAEFSRIMESLNKTSNRKKFSGAPL